MGGRGSSGGARTPGGILMSTVKRAEDMGASLWEKGGRSRLYLNGAGASIVGLETESYKSGSISSAKYEGERISNAQGARLGLALSEAYIDLNTGELHMRESWQMGRETTSSMKKKIKSFFKIKE